MIVFLYASMYTCAAQIEPNNCHVLVGDLHLKYTSPQYNDAIVRHASHLYSAKIAVTNMCSQHQI